MSSRASPIHLIATSTTGRSAALCQFDELVEVWHLDPLRQLATHSTILSGGGRRCAISTDDQRLVAASWKRGVACYDANSGQVAWHRRDIQEIQFVTFSADDSTLYVCTDESDCHVLDPDRGETRDRWPSLRKVWCSIATPSILAKSEGEFEDEDAWVLLDADLSERASVRLETHAALAAVLSETAFCVSESRGAVRCFSHSNKLLWRYEPTVGTHVLGLAHDPAGGLYHAVEYSYKGDGSHVLVALDARSGKPLGRRSLGRLTACAFCLDSSHVLTSAPELVRTEAAV